MKFPRLLLLPLALVLTIPATPQNAALNLAASASTAVPPLVPYSGVVNTAAGQSPTNANVTFLIYNEEQGGEPLLSETQSVAVDTTGHFKAQIGATLTNGIPIDLFASGEARWLAVQIAGEGVQPRVLLASVPYALKAADAATLGGLPASAFALAGTKTFTAAAAAVSTPNVISTGVPITTTTGGFSGYLPVFTGSSTIANSTIFQNANGVGINAPPFAALDVTGRTIFRGTMVVSRNGNATSAAGVGSLPLQFFANGWNSTINGPVQPVMQLQAEPTGNNTASPGATLNLLYSNGVTNEAETGLYFNANGTIHFATGQTFPGAGGGGSGTITGVTAGTDLTGGGTTGNVTLNLDTTKVPLLAANNTFTGDQAINGNLSASGVLTAGTVNAAYGFDLFGLPFAFAASNGSIYLGFAGNSHTLGAFNTATGSSALVGNTTGHDNTATGWMALHLNTTGYYNTATGSSALSNNSTGIDNVADGIVALSANTVGYENTAVGFDALGYISTGYGNVGIGYESGTSADFSTGTGSNNTAVGSNAVFQNGSLSNATAIGAYAQVNQSNSVILGCALEVNNCPAAVSVGIGTPAPDATLTVNGNADKSGGGSWGTYSDGRLKTVNGSFGGGLNQVMQLRPIRYRYKPDNVLGIRDSDEHIGVVAQEVQRVIPEAVTENAKGYLLVNNDPIIWSMVNAIKEQQREIEEQQKLIRAQTAAVRTLTAQVRETRKTLREVKAQSAAGQPTLVSSR